MIEYVPSRASSGNSASSRSASGGGCNGCRGGTSSDIELGGLGIDGGSLGAAPHQVDAVASTRSGPPTAGRGNSHRACRDCIDEGCKNNITGQNLAILVSR
jgi:hypothetical protein